MTIFDQIVEELLAAGAKLDPLVFDSYLLPLHMAINKVPLHIDTWCLVLATCYMLLATLAHTHE